MNFKLLRQLIQSPIETGTTSASSEKISQLIADSANLPEKKSIVELGPGTGVFTKQIIQRISSGTLFFCLEINEQFVKDTRSNCPNAIVYHASALDIKKYLLKHNLKHCDCIVSGLPWGLFGLEIQKQLLNEVYDSLESGGKFLAIAYITGLMFKPGIRFKKLLNQKFQKVEKTRIIWGNILPAFIYICTK